MESLAWDVKALLQTLERTEVCICLYITARTASCFNN